MGIIYAGGVQTIKAGLLPLSRKRLRKRIATCFRRSVEMVPLIDPLKPALQRLQDGLRAAIESAHTPEMSALMAITGTDEKVFAVHVTGLFAKWFDNRDDASRVLRWLHENGFLVVRDRARAERVGFTIDSVRHTRRLAGKNCAAIVFRDPIPSLMAVLGPQGRIG